MSTPTDDVLAAARRESLTRRIIKDKEDDHPTTATLAPLASIEPVTALHYAANGNFNLGSYNAPGDPGAVGFNLADVSSIAQADSLPSGVKGLIWLDATSGITASFQSIVNAAAHDPKVYGFYVADEPPDSAIPNLALADAYIALHAPGKVSFIVAENNGTPQSPSYGVTPDNTGADLIGLDPYPVRPEFRGGMDLSVIATGVNAALAAGWQLSQIVPVYQAFGGGGYSSWTLPTANQEQQILAEWGNLVPSPAFDYAYSWGTQSGDSAISNTPDLQNVFAEHNSPACFVRGTLILTPDGQVPVENLKIGDTVLTQSGTARPIKWIGRRAYHPRFVRGNRSVLPIKIEAGALATDLPTRDLWVSPEHALYLRGALVPAELLVNDATISQPEWVDDLEYFHLDLGTHDVIFAEGAAAESYVDCDNRDMFHNVREFAQLYPREEPPRWEFCARRMMEGSPELAAIRGAVLARAKLLGRFTDDPGLHLIVDGAAIQPQLIANGRVYRFQVPASSRSIVLASRSTVPLKIERSSADKRRLGVPVKRIVLRGTGLEVAIGANCPTLCQGFHDAELDCRWTDGRGHLPAELPGSFVWGCVMEVHLTDTEFLYGLETPAAAAKSRAIAARPRAQRAGALR